MKFKIGNKVRVVSPYSGGNFEDGDIVEIVQIGFEDEDCYGAISPHDNMMWFLQEDEVAPATNADKIRSMTNEELAEWLVYRVKCAGCNAENCDEKFCVNLMKEWIEYLYEEQ